MSDEVARNIACPRCGADAFYAGMVGMPTKSIYQCNSCGRATWVPVARPPAQAGSDVVQQQQQPQPPDGEPNE
jgi:DNA-directed RNA polymerase subunit RPC12/RpoP